MMFSIHSPHEAHHKGISNAWKCAAWLAIIGQGVFLWLGIYLYLFQGAHPVEFKNMPFPVDAAIYEHGDYIILEAEYCKNTYEGETTVYISFIDGLVFDRPAQIVSGVPKGCGTARFRVQVPQTLPAGEYKLIGKNVYHVNVLRDRTVTWETVKFRIVDDK